MNLWRVIVAAVVGGAITYGFLCFADAASSLATASGYRSIDGILGLGLACGLVVLAITVALTPVAERSYEATSEGFLVSQPVIEPHDGKLVLKPGQRVMVVSDMPRDERGRYLKLP